jgi:hypothetical protein
MKKVSFVATKYKQQKVKVDFYTQQGEKVAFKAVQVVPKKEKIEFYIETPKKKTNWTRPKPLTEQDLKDIRQMLEEGKLSNEEIGKKYHRLDWQMRAVIYYYKLNKGLPPRKNTWQIENEARKTKADKK